MGKQILNGIEYCGSNQGGGSGHDYSTTEQTVGTWIDSKPLYERVVEFSSSDFTDYGSFNQAYKSISNASINVKQIIGYGKSSSGNVLPIPTYSGTSLNSHTYEMIVWTSSESGTNSVYIRRMGSTSYDTFWVIVQYTKTTD